MIRELIEQIEQEKLAEQISDPYFEMMKLAFFDELELIEKDAGALRELGKRTLGFLTGKGVPAAERATVKAPRVSWTANLQPTVDPAAAAARRAGASSEAASALGQQQRRAWELEHVVGPKPAGFRA